MSVYDRGNYQHVTFVFYGFQTKKGGCGNKEQIDIGTGRDGGSFSTIIVSIISSTPPTKNLEVM